MSQPPILYRETRITPTPTSPDHILHIDTTGGQAQRQLLARAGSKRPFDEISGLDEESYAKKHLATDACVFFRSKARSPRSFLWRIVNERRTLEIQSVDLVKSNRADEASSWLTFRLAFKDPILQQGVAFADPVETDALECFVITEGRELFTVTLRRDLLTRGGVPASFDPSACVKRYSSSFLSVRHPYRFHAVSNLELLVSLGDGGLVRLERNTSENGAQWRETYFSEGGWSGTLTLKKFNPFAHQQLVRYGEIELDPSAIADMTKSPDGKYVWTVSLDHWLKAWSTQTGKVVTKIDLLGENNQDSQRKHLPYVMSAEQGKLLQIVSVPASNSGAVAQMDVDEPYCIVLQSPKDHQFKIYEIRNTFSAGEESVHFKDMQDRVSLIPPVEEMMDTNIWHLEDFYIQPGADWKDTQLWIRARSGTVCRVYSIVFDAGEDDNAVKTQDQWDQSWTSVDSGPLICEELRHAVDFPGDVDMSANLASTPTEKWLTFIFYPGRFSTASVETALYVYRKGRGLPASGGRGIKMAEQPLEERLSTAISSKILLRRPANEQPDYERYQQDIQAQWHTFYSLLSHLHNRRHESIGFGFDAVESLPWSVCADYVAPIRACNDLERRLVNTKFLAIPDADENPLYQTIYPEYINEGDQVRWESVYFTRLAIAARELRRSLSASARTKLTGGAIADAMVPFDQAPPGRAAALYEKAGFETEVSDEDFDALASGVESLGGIGKLNDDLFMGLLEWLDADGDIGGRDSRQYVCVFGVSVAVEVARETLEQHQALILDLLALIVFMSDSFETNDLHKDFNADDAYDAAVQRLRRVELLLWLVRHTRYTTHDIQASRTQDQITEIPSEMSLLEDVFVGDWRSYEEDTPTSITSSSKAWLSGIQKTLLDSWDGVTAHVLAFLLGHKELDLAQDFLTFTTDATAWSIYLRGRLNVATGDYAQASIDFNTAAEGMSDGLPSNTAGFFTPDEMEYFGHGYAAYFQHITAVFEKLKAYSYVADFAALALQHTDELPDFTRSMAALDRKKKHGDSPAVQQTAMAQEEMRLLRIKEMRNEILSRLFNALKETGRFKEAYDALAQIEGPPMKRSGLKRLIDTCMKQDAIPALLDLPFSGELALEADRALAQLAKKSTSSSSTPAAHQILYAFRAQRADFRGAAEVLYEHLMQLKHTQQKYQDPEDETLTQIYVLLINTLACCGEEDAWLLAEQAGRKRRLVTLADLRREYTGELDRRSDLLHGRFAFVGAQEGDEMDVL